MQKGLQSTKKIKCQHYFVRTTVFIHHDKLNANFILIFKDTPGYR